MSRSSPKVRDNTHSGEGRLIQLRQLSDAPMQLKQEIVEKHDEIRPYTENRRSFVTGVACHPAASYP